jgi:hypothetical protein
MKKILLVGFLSLFFGLFSANEAMAQTKVRVRFAKGANSATVKGRVSGYNYVDYIVGAKAGQTMSVAAQSKSNFLQFVIFDQNMENVEGASGVTDWNGELASSGNYTIRVLLPRAEARRKGTANYNLTISIY